MANQTVSTIAKTAGVNIVALLAAYLMNRVADKNTGFTDTRMAITTVALQAVQEAVTLKLSEAVTQTAGANEAAQASQNVTITG